MTPLDFLKPDIRVRGLVPNQIVTLVSVTQRGSHAVRVIFSLPDGKLQDQMLYREDEARLELVDDTRRWAFDGDGAMLRLLSEAYRIRLAHLFDPLLAVHTSLIEPLPHQITAVYEDMLNRQPLRFLLADDPGAGKTIMAGLLIRELIVRGDVSRCMICAPGSLTQQWQDEMHDKFQLDFAILSREMIESAHQGDPFGRNDLLIVRLDQVARDPDLRDRLRRSEWDLIVCDEAHKMSASYSGGEKSETKRYQLGKLLGEITRHFLLMTATPHNGKEEDFHLFMALLDADRFEGRPRAGAPPVDVGDVMRRMVKERLLRFDGRRLFPERIAQTINYTLSHDEAELYEAVTGYVRQEFNRADKLAGDGRKNTVGFALTVLQRRLASSPEAIYQSLRRRRERLEVRVRAAQQELRDLLSDETVVWDEPDWDELEAEMELNTATSELVDKASASQTIAELQAEIAHLRALEAQAGRLRSSKTDRKWIELKNLLHILLPPRSEGSDASTRAAHKLVIFTEHLDTLRYLETGLKTLIGRPDAVVSIHGGVDREARHAIQEAFRNDPEVTILLATDAAGEGINLQRAHLMVNYDLPWNPNRLEQRFGRIHRIGQTEVCQLYNLVAGETREGEVFQHLLRKLERERDALDGQVFDVLGKLFQQTPLRDLLVEAIRYGDDPDTRARLEQQLDHVMDIDRVRDLLERGALAGTRMDTSQVTRIRESMERAAARRLQPHYIKTFFLEAFAHLKGTVYERENGRYAIQNVPAEIRTWAKAHGLGTLPRSYERICFEKTLIQPRASGDRSLPAAAFVCPGHPLLDAVIGMILEQESPLLQQGAILIDDTDPGTQPRVLYYLDQRIEDGVMTAKGERHIVSREVHFVEIAADGSVREAGGAPYLDYRPATAGEKAALHSLIGGQTRATRSPRRKPRSTPRHTPSIVCSLVIWSACAQLVWSRSTVSKRRCRTG